MVWIFGTYLEINISTNQEIPANPRSHSGLLVIIYEFSILEVKPLLPS